jgi:SSS family solute:Na+ symporter
MIHFSTVDSTILFLYFVAVVSIGVRAARHRKKDTDEFILAGRSLTLPMFVATLVSTWYGGILGVGEFSFRYGISNWVVFGVPYYIFALVFALFLAEKIRSTNFYTIPDKLQNSYDKKTALLGGFLTFFLVSPAAYVLMLGLLLQLVFGINLILSVVLVTVLTISYLYLGGFRSDVWTNAFEFILMYLGFALMVVFCYAKFGGWEFLRTHVPPLHLTLHGGNSWQFILVWFFIALWTLVDPAFHQRCYAAKDGATARRGILVSIIFWFCFDFLTTTAGLYSRALMPDLAQPTFSYPLLAERILPAVAKGMFFVSMIATIMASLSSLTLISAITVGKDIVGRIMPGGGSPSLINRWTKIGLVLSAFFSIVLALLVPSVVNLWYTIGSCIIPGLLIPILAGYFDPLKIDARFAFIAMATGWIVSTTSFLHGKLSAVDGVPAYWLGIEPMYPGLLAALAIWGVGKIVRARRVTIRTSAG